MTGSPARRITGVLLGYAGVAWVVLQAAGWVRPALALPALFDTLLRGGLAFGVPVAIVIAWHYPRLALGVADADARQAVESEATASRSRKSLS